MAIVAPWKGVAEPLHRRLAHLADTAAQGETLWVGCGFGRSALWWAERFRTRVQAVDPDPAALETAERAARAADLHQSITFQHADPADLPHEAEVFDLSILNVLQLGGAPSAELTRQAVRVVRKGGTVIGVVPTWLRTPAREEAHRAGEFGIAPLLLVEWKGLFREAGVVEMTVEGAASEAGWFADGWLGLVARAWRVRRWRGVRVVLGPSFRTLRRLVLQRTLGLSIVKGMRRPDG